MSTNLVKIINEVMVEVANKLAAGVMTDSDVFDLLKLLKACSELIDVYQATAVKQEEIDKTVLKFIKSTSNINPN